MPAGRYRLTDDLLAPFKQGNVTDTATGTAHVFVKRNDHRFPYAVANEYFCGELARVLRLPVPPGFIAELPGRGGETAFVSLGFNLYGEKLPRIDPAAACAAEPDVAAGVVVFDLWVLKTDRHAHNVSFDEHRVPHRLNMFDHSHAPDIAAVQHGLARPEQDFVINAEFNGNRHCFLDHIRDDRYLLKWIDRIRGLPATLISEILDDAAELGWPLEHRQAVRDTILRRQPELAGIIWRSRDQFTNVAQWGLAWPSS